jgi:hypothetical protein
MWQAYVDGTGCETMVFRSRPAAEQWIQQKVRENFQESLDQFPV